MGAHTRNWGQFHTRPGYTHPEQHSAPDGKGADDDRSPAPSKPCTQRGHDARRSAPRYCVREGACKLQAPCSPLLYDPPVRRILLFLLVLLLSTPAGAQPERAIRTAV